ncbi:hypothetical protein OPQ81_006343 [Rhizoctonia solani]|nr:hypothetical protein OPQ81_006343 [Rhizoctonia solani]
MPEFTPVQIIDHSKEKRMAAQARYYGLGRHQDLGRYVGVTVDTNFTQIAKLPRYAEFGTLSGESSSAGAVATETSAPSAPAPTESGSTNPGDPGWKPTRRVRTVPGGAQTFHLGDGEEESPSGRARSPRVVDSDGNAFKPTRRVRTAPGGKDSIAAFLGGE